MDGIDNDDDEELTVVVVVATVVSELNEDGTDMTALDASMDTDKMSLFGLRGLDGSAARVWLRYRSSLLPRRLPLPSTALSFMLEIDPAHVMLLPMLILHGITVFI